MTQTKLVAGILACGFALYACSDPGTDSPPAEEPAAATEPAAAAPEAPPSIAELIAGGARPEAD